MYNIIIQGFLVYAGDRDVLESNQEQIEKPGKVLITEAVQIKRR